MAADKNQLSSLMSRRVPGLSLVACFAYTLFIQSAQHHRIVITYVRYHKERRKVCTSVISHYIPDRYQQQQEQQKWQSHIMHITNNQSNITIKNVYHIWTLQKCIKHLEPQHMQQGKQHDSEVSVCG